MVKRIDYTLRHPIETLEGAATETPRTVTITTLSLAPRVKGRHMRATDGARGPVEAKLLLISSLAGISRAEADELDEEDVLAIDMLYDEDSDLAVIAKAAGLPSDAPRSAILAAIAALKLDDRRDLDVPLDGGGASPVDGPKISGTSPVA